MACRPTTGASGFTLIELLVALLLLAVAVLGTAPLFVFAARENAIGGDLGTVGALAVRQMETLRAEPYVTLSNGGNLATNVSGYFDSPQPGFVVRWMISDNPNPPAPTKIITVRAIAQRQTHGKNKKVTLVGVRGG